MDETGLAAWSLTQLLAALAARLPASLASQLAVCELGCGVAPAALPLVLLESPVSTHLQSSSSGSQLSDVGHVRNSKEDGTSNDQANEYDADDQDADKIRMDLDKIADESPNVAVDSRSKAALEGSGPRRVVLTDVNEEALARLSSSLEASGRLGAGVEVQALDWADLQALEKLEAAFDLVLASEVLYYNVDVACLMNAGAKLLKKSHGVWILCSFLRGTSLRELRQKAAESGLHMRLLDIFRVNEEMLQGPAQVEGYAVLCAMHAVPETKLGSYSAGDELDFDRPWLWETLGLAPYEISLEEAITGEDEEDAEASGAVWNVPFAGDSDSE